VEVFYHHMASLKSFSCYTLSRLTWRNSREVGPCTGVVTRESEMYLEKPLAFSGVQVRDRWGYSAASAFCKATKTATHLHSVNNSGVLGNEFLFLTSDKQGSPLHHNEESRYREY
jgi:hypothetical protein